VSGLLDMSAYLAVAPVVTLHNRLRSRAPDLIGLLTFAGLAYALLGSLGGTIFATVEPPLVGEGSDAARAMFAAFATLVTVTQWGTLELIFLGAWLIGLGWLLRAVTPPYRQARPSSFLERRVDRHHARSRERRR
jgi:hypothetical protein